MRTTNSPITSLVRKLQEDKLNIDPPYQRGSVWGMDRKIALIKSMTIGLPIGSIFLDNRPFPEWPAVIDGKQRILAVLDWFEDRVFVPSAWFEDREIGTYAELVSYGALSDIGRRRWENHSLVQVYWSNFRGTKSQIEVQEQALFDLINFGGVPQGESDEV